MTKHELPSPEQILEELADRAALQIDRLAPVAFEATLRELVRYHRFLLALNAARNTEGSPVSLAEVGGSSWLAPHQEWVRQYRRLFERAAGRLADDADFVAKLADVPRHLLPLDGEFELSAEVLRSLVGLIPLLANRLEGWATKRSKLGADDLPALAGADAEIYANVISDMVGTWEGFLHDGSSMFGDEITQESTNSMRWDALRSTWPFLWEHMQDTAGMLATAVWRENRLSASLYSDALIRWPVTYDSDLLDEYYLPRSGLILPDVLSLNWEAVVAQLRYIHPGYEPEPSPKQLFHAVLRGAHSDVILLTSGLFLFWKINNKQRSRLGVETAEALLQRILNEPDELIGSRPFKASFRARFSQLVRLAIVDVHRHDGNYDSRLDRLVEVLDRMTERRVVTGRVFSPSTLNDRSALLIPVLAFLLAEMPDEADDGVVDLVRQLAAMEYGLPDDDRSLRQLSRELNAYMDALTKSGTHLAAALELLVPGSQYEALSSRLQIILQSCIGAIDSHRTERLTRKPVDRARLERLRASLESAILTPPAAIPFFRKFNIETRAAMLRVNLIERTLMERFPKAQLVSPPMENEISNLEETLSRALRKFTTSLVFDSFRERRREAVKIDEAIAGGAFWENLKPLADQVGQCPVLVTSSNAEGRAIRTANYRVGRSDVPFKIEKAKPDGVLGNYIGTIEGIEVYAGHFEAGTAWLFSGMALVAVRYYAVNEAEQHLSLDFEASSGIEGVLKVRLMQVVDWTVDPIFQIELRKGGYS